MAYLNSASIEVFPATRRTFNSSHARQVTEASLVGMINRLIDVDSFVVSKLETDNQGLLIGSQEFSFNIHGYYFMTTLNPLIDLGGTDIYASIQIDTTSGTPAFYELLGQDVNGEYQGVNFSNSEVTGDNIYCLHLLHDGDNGWEIPYESQVKFSPDSIDIKLIDGGEI